MLFSTRFLVVIAFACCLPLFLAGHAVGAEILRYAGTTTLQRDFMLEASNRFGAVNDVRFVLEGGNSGAGLKAIIAKKFIPLTDK